MSTTAAPRLPRPQDCLLLLIDVQEKLCAAMPEHRLEDVLRSATIVLEAAQLWKCPLLVTEQYPRGLGRTQAALSDRIEAAGASLVEKTRFSAVGVPDVDRLLDKTAPQAVIVLGMEAHVCVHQTVRDLVARGLATWVLADGVCSRRDDHRAMGLEQCREAGAHLTMTETLVFDWLEDATHPHFKTLSKLVR